MILSQTIIGSAPVVPKGTRPLPTAAQLKEYLSFSYFDTLYGYAHEQYLEMLDLYAEEYQIYLKGIDTALENKDEAAFRRIKHKIIYSLHLLDLSSVHNNMEVLAGQFATLDGYQRISARHAYASAFGYILTSIHQQRLLLAGKTASPTE